jgi:hypothetical protein
MRHLQTASPSNDGNRKAAPAAGGAVVANLPCEGRSVGSKPPQPHRCGPTTRRTLHKLSSPFANTPCFTSFCRCPPGAPGRTRPRLSLPRASAVRPGYPRLRGGRRTGTRAQKMDKEGLPTRLPQVNGPHRGAVSLRVSLEYAESRAETNSSQRDFS